MSTYILRWNPNISSYRAAEHTKNTVKLQASSDAFYNWSFYEHEEVDFGDTFIFLQVGTDNDGIAGFGTVFSEAYEEDSWRKDGTTIHYADINFFCLIDRTVTNKLNADEMAQVAPGIDWHGGHSGVKISDEDAENILMYMARKCGYRQRPTKAFGYSAYEVFADTLSHILGSACPRFTKSLMEKKGIKDDEVYLYDIYLPEENRWKLHEDMTDEELLEAYDVIGFSLDELEE